MAPRSTIPFPILAPEVLVAESATTVFAVSLEDLRAPTPPKIQTIYEAWMIRHLGINIQDCLRAAEQQMDHMEDADIYREAMFVGVFQRTFCQLTEAAKIPDFTTKDLSNPTPDRVQIVLSGLINFHLFEGEQNEHILAPLVEENEENTLNEEELITKNQALREKIEAERERRRQNLPRLDDIKADSKERAANLTKLKDRADATRKKDNEKRAEVKEVQLSTQQIILEISQREMDLSRLQNQLLSSPDRMKSRMHDMQLQLASQIEDLKLIEQKERQMQTKISSLAKYEGELASCIKLLDEWEVDVNKLTEGKLRYQQRQEALETLQSEQVELENQINILNRRLTNSRDEISRFDDKTERKRAAGKSRKKLLEGQHATLVERKRTLDMEAAMKNREAAEVEAEIRAIHATTQAEFERGETQYNQIKHQVEIYSLKINKALDSLNALTAKEFHVSAL